MVNLKDIKVNINVDMTDISMSDEVKNEWVNDPLDKMLDKWKHSGPKQRRLIKISKSKNHN
jgi:spore coat protein CotH